MFIMEDFFFIFGILLGVGLAAFLGWAVFWRVKEKGIVEPTSKAARKKVARAIEKVRTPQIVVKDLSVGKSTFTAVIDFIVINAYGVFVVHVVRYAGKITGGREDNEWLQTKEDGEVNAFFNPLFQNAAHVRFAKDLLPEGAPVRSLVVFVCNNPPETNKNATDTVALKKLKRKLSSGKRILKKDQINAYGAIFRKKKG